MLSVNAMTSHNNNIVFSRYDENSNEDVIVESTSLREIGRFGHITSLRSVPNGRGGELYVTVCREGATHLYIYCGEEEAWQLVSTFDLIPSTLSLFTLHDCLYALPFTTSVMETTKALTGGGSRETLKLQSLQLSHITSANALSDGRLAVTQGFPKSTVKVVQGLGTPLPTFSQIGTQCNLSSATTDGKCATFVDIVSACVDDNDSIYVLDNSVSSMSSTVKIILGSTIVHTLSCLERPMALSIVCTNGMLHTIDLDARDVKGHTFPIVCAAATKSEKTTQGPLPKCTVHCYAGSQFVAEVNITSLLRSSGLLCMMHRQNELLSANGTLVLSKDTEDAYVVYMLLLAIHDLSVVSSFTFQVARNVLILADYLQIDTVIAAARSRIVKIIVELLAEKDYSETVHTLSQLEEYSTGPLTILVIERIREFAKRMLFANTFFL